MGSGMQMGSLGLLALFSSSAWAAKVTVPVDVGIGPATHMITGVVADDQPMHTGLVLSVEAIIDKKTLKQNKKKIPKQYRSAIKNVDEIRISPSMLIPDTIFISPPRENTAMYGISWTPVGVGVPLVTDPFRLRLGASLRLTYAFITSDTLGDTHFLRPGIDPGASVEIPLSETFLVSFGWNSQLYVPQPVGGGIGDFPDDFSGIDALSDSIWHIGQGFFKFHYRFPYTVKI